MEELEASINFFSSRIITIVNEDSLMGEPPSEGEDDEDLVEGEDAVKSNN